MVPAAEVKMVRPAAEEETVGMLQGITTPKMVRMVTVAAGECRFVTRARLADGFALHSGGYGSNGADGAAGGHIFITVNDEDTDLLLPLEFDVQGGAGGQSGQHGEPGDGGIGGRGGRAFAWFVSTVKCAVYGCGC